MVLDGHIEVKGRLVGDDILLGDGEQRREAVDKIRHAAAAHDNPLGVYGLAGGEVYIKRVRINGPSLD